MAMHDQETPLLFDDDFDGGDLDPSRWFGCYLPHWSTVEQSAACYVVRDGVLRLHVGDDQEPWCPRFDGGVRVSSVQTGHWSGPVGSGAGQHRFRDGLVVQTYHAPLRLFTPRYCYLEMRARASLPPGTLASLWMIGYEDEPDRSGEITVMEIFGDDLAGRTMVLGHGIKRIRDPRLRDEFFRPCLGLDATDWHRYAVDWQADGVRFFVDGTLLSSTTQAPQYPMQLMLNVYDLSGRGAGARPWFEVDNVRAWPDRPPS
jgi:hypothetical protein